MSSNQQQSQRNQVIPEEMEGALSLLEFTFVFELTGDCSPKAHSQTPRLCERTGTSRLTHIPDDEAFARYQMGDPNPHRQADEKTQVNTMNQSITQNHHARGGAKEKAKEGPRREEMEDLQPQLREML
ncbi:hypothetical protein CC2G_014890 [Coprinopsis cinerea AmutBmut pab1-1]|nr:hypothetical protein CC2G_014890 [Coprinopsis cinerea AmutBmut pab1-1]